MIEKRLQFDGVAWIKELPEVGGEILREAERIEELFRNIEMLRREAERQYEALEAKIAQDWTKTEIKNAKRDA